MAIRPISIPPLQERVPIVDEQRRPAPWLIRALNAAFKQIQTAFNGQAAIVEQLAILAGIVDDQGNIIADQQTQLDAQALYDAEISLQNSGTINPDSSPFISSDDAGNVTIEAHERRYGNMTLNPTVSVQSGLVATGLTVGAKVYIYYLDADRSGGAVSYAFTTDPADVVQSGNLHSVGSVVVPPAAGTGIGIPVVPRGIT